MTPCCGWGFSYFRPLRANSGHRNGAFRRTALLIYAASVLRTPSALIARCSINWGSRSPVATTLTIALAISSVIGSSRLTMPRLTSALS